MRLRLFAEGNDDLASTFRRFMGSHLRDDDWKCTFLKGSSPKYPILGSFCFRLFRECWILRITSSVLIITVMQYTYYSENVTKMTDKTQEICSSKLQSKCLSNFKIEAWETTFVPKIHFITWKQGLKTHSLLIYSKSTSQSIQK